jgi:hypothetical protein
MNAKSPSAWAALICTSLAMSGAALAQEKVPAVTYPAIPAKAAGANDFVPSGWKLEAQASGALDDHGAQGMALVLQDQDPRNVLDLDGQKFDSNPRLLVVALADGQGSYRQVLANHTLISRPDNRNQDDKFSGIEIVKGTLRVKLQNFMTMGGWTSTNYTYTFRLRNNALDLIGYDEMDVTRNTGAMETLSVNYGTGRYSMAKGAIDTDKETIRWHHLPEKRLPITLEQIGDGLGFSPLDVVFDTYERNDAKLGGGSIKVAQDGATVRATVQIGGIPNAGATAVDCGFIAEGSIASGVFTGKITRAGVLEGLDPEGDAAPGHLVPLKIAFKDGKASITQAPVADLCATGVSSNGSFAHR